MKAKFIGKSEWVEVWKNQNESRKYKLIKNREFAIGVWDGEESVLTGNKEWICDIDSGKFKENFQIIKEV